MPVKVEINRNLLAAQVLGRCGRVLVGAMDRYNLGNAVGVHVYRLQGVEVRKGWFGKTTEIEHYRMIATLTAHLSGHQYSVDKVSVFGRQHLMALAEAAEELSTIYQQDIRVVLETEKENPVMAKPNSGFYDEPNKGPFFDEENNQTP